MVRRTHEPLSLLSVWKILIKSSALQSITAFPHPVSQGEAPPISLAYQVQNQMANTYKDRTAREEITSLNQMTLGLWTSLDTVPVPSCGFCVLLHNLPIQYWYLKLVSVACSPRILISCVLSAGSPSH